MKKDKKIIEKLNILKHTRPRIIMPRPAIFEDKTKYKRSRQKQTCQTPGTINIKNEVQ